MLLEKGALVTVLENSTSQTLVNRAHRLRRLGAVVKTGPLAHRGGGPADLVVVSPGIDPRAPLFRSFLDRRIAMIGELELGFEMCGRPVIAITGTNGKTTTTELVARMLNGCGISTVACGNIGLPLSDAVLECPDAAVMTVEVSSFQLERIERFHPEVAVWLNFSPDHLDRYPDLEAYRNAKLRIFENQTEEDWAVINAAEPMPPLKARRITFSAQVDGGDFSLRESCILYQGREVLRMEETELRGPHNAENLMAALAVGVTRGLSFEAMRKALAGFQAGPHRCEVVADINGVRYLNDSKATNADSLEKALLSRSNPVLLIAGGKEKGFSFDGLGDLLRKKVRRAFLIGETADRMLQDWSNWVDCEKIPTLEAAVVAAAREARPGEEVLLSPGTSSFDMFSGYEERGNCFRAAVEKLKEQEL